MGRSAALEGVDGQGITYQRLGPDDADILPTVPDGLLDEPDDPEQVRAFLDDPRHQIVPAFDGDLAVSMATATGLLHPDKPPSMFITDGATRDSHLRRGTGKIAK